METLLEWFLALDWPWKAYLVLAAASALQAFAFLLIIRIKNRMFDTEDGELRPFFYWPETGLEVLRHRITAPGIAFVWLLQILCDVISSLVCGALVVAMQVIVLVWHLRHPNRRFLET